MSSSRFVYIDTATGGPFNRNNVQRLDQFKPNGTPDVYSTYRLFTEDLPAYMSTNLNPKNGQPSVRGYNGPCRTPHLPFDIDVEGDLDTARDELHRLLALLRDRWEIPLEAVTIYFSGHKGFHAEVPEALFGGFGVLKAQESATRLKRLSKLMLQEADSLSVDPAIYDATRLWRAPNTKNGKSGLYKVRITAAEALHLTAAQIKELARQPRHIEAPDADDWDRIPALVTAWNATAQSYQERPNTATADNSEPITRNRNIYLTGVGGRLRAAGLGEAPIAAALIEHNLERCQPPLPEREVRQIAASIARYPAGGLPPPPDPSAEVQELLAENEELRTKLRHAEEAALSAIRDTNYITELEQRIRDLLDLPNALHALMTNPAMTPAVKVATYILSTQWHNRKDNEHDLDPELGVRMNMTRAAEIAGVDTETLSTTARKLQEATGVWEYNTVHERYNEQAKRPLTHSYIKMVDGNTKTMAATMRTFADKACGRKSWTPREKLPLIPEACTDCGNPTVFNETIKHCKSCDHILEEKKPVQVKHRAAPENSERSISAPIVSTQPAPENSTQRLDDTSVPEIPERQERLPLVQRATPPTPGIEEIVIPPAPPARAARLYVRQSPGGTP